MNPRQRNWLLAAAATLLGACAVTPAPDAAAVIRQAQTAMGSDTLKSISFAGKGTGSAFGQAYQPGLAWPKVNFSHFSRVADYDNNALRQDTALSRAEPNGGGAVPLMGQGEARATALVQGGFAWNMAGPAPVATPRDVDQRMHDLWTSPHGVIKAAARNRATASARPDGAGASLSFSEPGRFTATVTLSVAGLVERIDSRLPHPVLGDTDVVTTFSDYRDHGGVKFPARMRQNQGGHEVLDIQVDEVKINVASGIETPALVKAFAERVVSEKVADGVWHLAGGSHNSVLIEMKDHLIIVEAPLYDGRSAAVFAEARRLVPGKPVRQVINSHHHFDHAGGLRTAVAEGVTLVTSAAAKPWWDKALANPNRISPDRMAQSGRSAAVIGVGGRMNISDGQRNVVVHEIAGSIHVQGFLMVHLPAEKLLIEADAYTPGPPNSPSPARVNDNHVNLVSNIERLQLQVDRILPLHGRVVPLSELHTAVGRR